MRFFVTVLFVICRPLLGGGPLTVPVQGLEYMNDDPACVDVLYAKVNPGPQTEKSVSWRIVSTFVNTMRVLRSILCAHRRCSHCLL